MIALDLSGLNVYIPGNTYEVADRQAEIVIKELTNKIPDVDWKIVDSTDTKQNLEMGDINGFKDGKLVYMIDLKVAALNNKGYIGTIDLNSILRFANNDKALYLCVSCDGKRYETFWGKDIYNRFMSNEPSLIKTKHVNRDKEINISLDKYKDKFIYKNDDGVSPYDFMCTRILKELKNKSSEI